MVLTWNSAAARNPSGMGTDPEVIAWLEHGFRAWWTAGGKRSLAESLGLPDNPEALARGLRDHWLAQAARDLPEPRAVHLAAAIARNIHRVRAWAREGGPPEDATLAMLSLYFAARSGAPMPTSAKQLGRILAWDAVRESVSAQVCHDKSRTHTGKSQ